MSSQRSPTNPLLEPLGPYIEQQDWPQLLEHNPLDGFPDNPTMEQRDEYLEYFEKRFAVTRSSVEMALDLQSMMRAGYRARNPCDPVNIHKLYEIAKLDKPFTSKSPTFYSNAKCKIIKAITQMGKSSFVNRFRASYDEVAIHNRCDSAQWLRNAQIVHLTVKMPGDGSCSGLLFGILDAIDSAVYTDYFNEYHKQRVTVAKLTIKVAQLLALYSVGLLIIEEIQAKNFKDAKTRHELDLFFLGVLSFGVPLLLVGNPAAFEDIGSFKQTESRFLSEEPVELWPYASAKEPDWRDAIARAIWNYQVIDVAEPYNQEVAQALWECSGGVPGYARTLVKRVQKSVMRRSAPGLTVDVLNRHYRELASFRSFRPLIEGLVQRDNNLISGSEDVSVGAFVEHWQSLGLIEPKSTPSPDASTEDASADATESQPTSNDWNSFSKGVQSNHKSKVSRQEKKAQKNEQMRKTSDVEDLRHGQTVQERLASGIKELQAKVERERKIAAEQGEKT